MTAQIKPHSFDLFNSMFFSNEFLCYFYLACRRKLNTRGNRDTAFQIIHRKLTLFRHSHAVGIERKPQSKVAYHGKTTAFMTYWNAVSYFLRAYASCENMSDYNDEIKSFMQPPNKTPTQHTKKLVAKIVHSKNHYLETHRSDILMRKRDKFIA